MQSQIDEPEAKLAHLGVRGAEIARVAHLVEQIAWDGLAGLVMAREKIQRLALPAPILHDLRGKLDEIPGDVRTRQAAYFHLAEAVVQQVSELVKNGLDFAVRQQGWTI